MGEQYSLTKGERYEVELLLDALPLDDADGLGAAAAASDAGEAVELYLGYCERGFRDLFTHLAHHDLDVEYL